MKSLIRLAGASALAVLATNAIAAEPPKMDQASSMSYALGYQVGRDLTGTEVRNDALLQGLLEAIEPEGGQGEKGDHNDPQSERPSGQLEVLELLEHFIYLRRHAAAAALLLL